MLYGKYKIFTSANTPFVILHAQVAIISIMHYKCPSCQRSVPFLFAIYNVMLPVGRKLCFGANVCDVTARIWFGHAKANILTAVYAVGDDLVLDVFAAEFDHRG